MRRSTGYSMNGRSLAVTSFRGTSNRMSQTASAANTSMPSSRVLLGTMSRSARQYTAAPLANMSAASEARSRNALDMLSRIHIRTSSSDTDMIRSTRINMVGTDPAGDFRADIRQISKTQLDNRRIGEDRIRHVIQKRSGKPDLIWEN